MNLTIISYYLAVYYFMVYYVQKMINWETHLEAHDARWGGIKLRETKQ